MSNVGLGHPFPYIENYNHLDILHEARDINYGPRLKSLFWKRNDKKKWYNPVKLREIRRDVNTATPDDIISNCVAQNARYYQHKKDRPESTHSLNVADDVLY
jgi:hypothetical protein